MKLLSNNLLETLSIRELQNLASQVNETLDVTCKKEKRKIFSSADLWNIQRQRKNNFTRRFFQ